MLRSVLFRNNVPGLRQSQSLRPFLQRSLIIRHAVILTRVFYIPLVHHLPDNEIARGVDPPIQIDRRNNGFECVRQQRALLSAPAHLFPAPQIQKRAEIHRLRHLMQMRRAEGGAAVPVAGLCRGPGNLTKALGISLAQNRLALTAPPLSIEDWGVSPGRVTWGPRIGLRVGTDRAWRCWVAGHACVSGRRTSMSGDGGAAPPSRRG